MNGKTLFSRLEKGEVESFFSKNQFEVIMSTLPADCKFDINRFPHQNVVNGIEIMPTFFVLIDLELEQLCLILLTKV